MLGGLGAGDAALAGSEPPAQVLQVQLGSPREAAPPPPPRAARRAAPTRYLGSGEVDERAKPIEVPALIYPEKAYLNRIAGTVRLRIYVSAEGRIDKADIVAAKPAGHFEQAALDAVRSTRFHPARKDGRPVASQKLIEVEFDPYGPTPEARP